MTVSKERVMGILEACYDPEIPVNIVDLGLIYDVVIQDSKVDIKMTLTSPGCPSSSFIGEEVKEKVGAIEGVTEVNVEFVWDPPWDPSRISDAGRQKLGIEI